MEQLFSDFQKVTKQQWEEKLTAELKGADFESSLKRQNELEEINYSTYAHLSDLTEEQKTVLPSTQFTKLNNNDWNIASLIVVTNEKEANKKALSLLMTGASAIYFQIDKPQINWEELFPEIGFEFIETHFILTHAHQYFELQTYFSNRKITSVYYQIDLLHNDSLSEKFDNLAAVNLPSPTRFCHVNAFAIQQCGATTWQEIAFALAEGHEYLVKLMNKGFTIDQAASCIHFSLGVGANYFFEIAKFRAFRELWSEVIEAYKPQHKHSLNAKVSAEIGLMNKSLMDPYTNLLRQTTEAMAAVSGGIETLLIHPYDAKSTKGASLFTERMAINTSLILREESYFDKVIDPLGGSYSIELLSHELAQKAWKQFQEIDADGGILSEKAAENFRSAVKKKSALRLKSIKEGDELLIGVNKYPNPEQEANSWLEKESYFGLQQIIIERDI